VRKIDDLDQLAVDVERAALANIPCIDHTQFSSMLLALDAW
jgi:hypothetical protein